MAEKVIRISATGTRGEVEGMLFVAKKDTEGFYTLNKKVPSKTGGTKTNRAANKVRVATLDEAARLVATNEYLINLVSDDGTRALREFKKVRIEYELPAKSFD